MFCVMFIAMRSAIYSLIQIPNDRFGTDWLFTKILFHFQRFWQKTAERNLLKKYLFIYICVRDVWAWVEPHHSKSGHCLLDYGFIFNKANQVHRTKKNYKIFGFVICNYEWNYVLCNKNHTKCTRMYVKMVFS